PESMSTSTTSTPIAARRARPARPSRRSPRTKSTAIGGTRSPTPRATSGIARPGWGAPRTLPEGRQQTGVHARLTRHLARERLDGALGLVEAEVVRVQLGQGQASRFDQTDGGL